MHANPLVSICMIAYNVEKFIEEALEGALNQKTDFPFELVIGEDCSKDRTRKICETYAKKYPGLVILLPSDINRGIAGNAVRTWQHCRGKYIAVCDGDDIWIDPYKLSNQVKFLEENPLFGAVYSDVKVISETGQAIDDKSQDAIRSRYADGRVFFQLLGGNFINNSTTVFRKELITDYEVDQDREYYTHDYLLWLYIALQSKIHFFNTQTTAYRRHIKGVTNSATKQRINRLKFQSFLPFLLFNFETKYPWSLTVKERSLIFQKILSVLFRNQASIKMQRKVFFLLPKYFPGIANLWIIFQGKMRNKLIFPKWMTPVR